jgi:hypothetical protein
MIEAQQVVSPLAAMKQVLEAWQTSVYGSDKHHKAMLLAMTKMNQAIANLESQEPVAWMYDWTTSEGEFLQNWTTSEAETLRDTEPTIITNVRPLYATPQPCPTCEALARTVMMDQTGRDL